MEKINVKNETTDILDTNRKRERSVNFSQEESELLVCLVERKRHIIENKKSTATTWHEKEMAWKELEQEFNNKSAFPVHRVSKHLKLKYEALKRDTRKKCAAIKAIGDTGTPAPALTMLEKKVKKIMLHSAEGNNSELSAEWNNSDLSDEGTFNDSDFVQPSEFLDRAPFSHLTEGIVDVAQFQSQLMKEDLEQKAIQRQILEAELEHKRILHSLEKEHMLLKIELIKVQLEKAKSTTRESDT